MLQVVAKYHSGIYLAENCSFLYSCVSLPIPCKDINMSTGQFIFACIFPILVILYYLFVKLSLKDYLVKNQTVYTKTRVKQQNGSEHLN